MIPAIRRVMAEVADGYRDSLRACALGVQPWPLFIHGPVGVGKTCGALCLIDYVRGPSAYHTVGSLCEELIACQQGVVWDDDGRSRIPRLVRPRDFWRSWEQLDLGVIDELGQRRIVSDHHYETLKFAIDYRKGRPLILLSNLDGDGLASVYDERMSSRCVSGTVVELRGDDRRLAK